MLTWAFLYPHMTFWGWLGKDIPPLVINCVVGGLVSIILISAILRPLIERLGQQARAAWRGHFVHQRQQAEHLEKIADALDTSTPGGLTAVVESNAAVVAAIDQVVPEQQP